MIIFLILVAGYCYLKHIQNKNWMKKQLEFYHNRTWYWMHHPEEFEWDRIHFKC